MNWNDVRAVVFDVGGTLVESAYGGASLWTKVASLCNVTMDIFCEHARDIFLTASSREELAVALASSLRLSNSKALLASLTSIDDRAYVLAGVENTLAILCRNYPLFVLSNCSVLSSNSLERAGLTRYFASAFYSCQMGLTKPSPKVFEYVEGHIGFSSHEILMVGNSLEHDIHPARKRGWKTLLLGKSDDEDILVGSGIDHLITNRLLRTD